MPRRWSWCPSALISDTSTPQRGQGTEVGAVFEVRLEAVVCQAYVRDHRVAGRALGREGRVAFLPTSGPSYLVQ